ncbi:MAG TPA: glycosyltransferase family 4 protein [Lacipirellula sp.]
MRIAYLAAGAAGMYCGSCLHDNTLAAALLKLGEDVILAPIYTPIRTDEQDVSEPRVFFGGVNAYLQQKFPVFRRTPRWLDRWLDHPALLRAVTGRAGSVDPAKLGDMTVSMLRGEAGNQRKELEKLVDWLVDEVRPDVVHLSNSMMVGLVRMIAARCGPPIVCTLSGEDIFLEKLTPPHYAIARQLLRERAKEVHAFVAMNTYYAEFMAEYLSVPRERVHVIPHGLELEGHGERQLRVNGSPARIGFFARICHDKGLHLLIDACQRLAARGDVPAFEVHAAGYLGACDRMYLDEIEHRVRRGPLAGRFKYHGELDRAGKIAFLQSLDVLSVPTVYRESKGLPVLEAWANGVPVVLPAHGAFPEMVAATGGGLLHRPLDPADLAEKLKVLLNEPERAKELGRRGRQAVHERYHARAMAERTLELYKSLRAAMAAGA